MPIFEYIERETGQVVELIRPIKDRDKPVVLKRKTVPARLGVVAGGTTPPTFAETMKKAYYMREQELGSDFDRRVQAGGHGSKHKVKKIWDDAT